MFPDPTTGEIHVDRTGAGPMEIRIHNSIGALVYDRQINGTTQRIDLNDVPRGIYMIRMRTAEGTTIERIVKE